MPTMSVADAKAGFAALLDVAASGDFVTITRHGKPAAVLVSLEAAETARRAMSAPQPNFGDFLSSYPGPSEIGRNPSPLRTADLE